MRSIAILALLVIGLVGCSFRKAAPVPGNLSQSSAPAYGKAMANDVVKKLAALYPPARTRINLQQEASDSFGASLVTGLRAKGYALAEFKSGKSTGAAAGAVSLTYVVDQPLEADQYRVTVLLDNRSLSRLYQAKDGALAPAGYWVRKE